MILFQSYRSFLVFFTRFKAGSYDFVVKWMPVSFLNYIILYCKIRIVKYTISRHVIIAVSVLSVRFVVKKHPPPLFFKAIKISTYNSNDLINHL